MHKISLLSACLAYLCPDWQLSSANKQPRSYQPPQSQQPVAEVGTAFSLQHKTAQSKIIPLRALVMFLANNPSSLWLPCHYGGVRTSRLVVPPRVWSIRATDLLQPLAAAKAAVARVNEEKAQVLQQFDAAVETEQALGDTQAMAALCAEKARVLKHFDAAQKAGMAVQEAAMSLQPDSTGADKDIQILVAEHKQSVETLNNEKALLLKDLDAAKEENANLVQQLDAAKASAAFAEQAVKDNLDRVTAEKAALAQETDGQMATNMNVVERLKEENAHLVEQLDAAEATAMLAEKAAKDDLDRATAEQAALAKERDAQMVTNTRIVERLKEENVHLVQQLDAAKATAMLAEKTVKEDLDLVRAEKAALAKEMDEIMATNAQAVTKLREEKLEILKRLNSDNAAAKDMNSEKAMLTQASTDLMEEGMQLSEKLDLVEAASAPAMIDFSI